MPGFFILAGLLHATVLSIIGFFVLFAASKAVGLVRRIGTILGAWIFLLAAIALVGPIVLGATGHAMMGHGMMGHHGWEHSAPSAAGPPPVATLPASNAAAPAPK